MANKKTNNKSDLGQDLETGLIVFRANLTNAPTGNSNVVRLDGTPTDEEMVLINKFSRRGNLDPSMLYAFDCTPSTQETDSYFTYMDTSSLINYANESKLGVPFMNSHRTGGRSGAAELPIGRSFMGIVNNDPDKEGQQIFSSSAYMLRNNMANGSVNTNDLIAAMEAGINSDISIQFTFSPGTSERNFEDRTWLRCSICGNDFLRSSIWEDGPEDCPHWPGEVYKSDGGKQQDLCRLGVINGHLIEYSSVYAGSTPGAIVNKARFAASEGFFNRSRIHHLEDVYRTRLMDYATFPAPVIQAQTRKEETEVVEEITNTPEPEIVETPKIERKVDEMANKRELEDAGKEGAKLALANLAKSIMGSRDFSESELALFPQVETTLAAGELDQANGLLTRLMSGATGDETEAGFFQDETRSEDADGEGTGEDEQTQQAVGTSIISLALTASERQQFQSLKDENNRLKRESKRLAPLAAIGERTWANLIDLTIESYGRAGLGDGEEIREMLSQLPFDHIGTLRVQYEEMARKLFGQHDQDENGDLIRTGQGGRQTVPANPNQPNFGQALNVAAQRAGVIKRNDFKAYK